MLILSKEIEDEAKRLRSDGMSLSKIKETLSEHGATERWVKRVCKGVEIEKQVTPKQIAVDEVYSLATRDIGVKDNELYQIYINVFGCTVSEDDGSISCNITQEQKAEVRKLVRARAEKEGKQAIFVPSWMSRQQPKGSNKLMLDLASQLHDRCNDLVSEFMVQFPDAWDVGVERELVYLAFRGIAPEGVERRCERNANVSGALEDGEYDFPVFKKKQVQAYMDGLKKECSSVADEEWDTIVTEAGY